VLFADGDYPGDNGTHKVPGKIKRSGKRRRCQRGYGNACPSATEQRALTAELAAYRKMDLDDRMHVTHDERGHIILPASS
jgi:hypothetical protein